VTLEGKVVVVTGGSSGIGRAIADGLVAEEAQVVIADLKPPEGGIRADVSDERDVERMAQETVERYGRVDILVNNAGLYASLAMRPFTEIPLDEWRQVMDVNVASMFLTCRAVVPLMRGQGGGKIVNISSGTPFRSVPFLLHYVTSKGAIVAFTWSCRDLMQASSAATPSRSTTCASTIWPRSSSGAPTTAHSATCAWESSAASTSGPAML